MHWEELTGQDQRRTHQQNHSQLPLRRQSLLLIPPERTQKATRAPSERRSQNAAAVTKKSRARRHLHHLFGGNHEIERSISLQQRENHQLQKINRLSIAQSQVLRGITPKQESHDLRLWEKHRWWRVQEQNLDLWGQNQGIRKRTRTAQAALCQNERDKLHSREQA